MGVSHEPVVEMSQWEKRQQLTDDNPILSRGFMPPLNIEINHSSSSSSSSTLCLFAAMLVLGWSCCWPLQEQKKEKFLFVDLAVKDSRRMRFLLLSGLFYFTLVSYLIFVNCIRKYNNQMNISLFRPRLLLFFNVSSVRSFVCSMCEMNGRRNWPRKGYYWTKCGHWWLSFNNNHRAVAAAEAILINIGSIFINQNY